jgi:hypothetical protein
LTKSLLNGGRPNVAFNFDEQRWFPGSFYQGVSRIGGEHRIRHPVPDQTLKLLPDKGVPSNNLLLIGRPTRIT